MEEDADFGSSLEEVRSLHEQRDRLEMALVNEILDKKAGHKEQLASQHRQKQLIDKYRECSKLLGKLYSTVDMRLLDATDPSAGQQDVSDRLLPASTTTDQNLTSFYLDLKKITSRPKVEGDTIDPELDAALLAVEASSNPLQTTTELTGNQRFNYQSVKFTDEESCGRYLDLNRCHEAYLQVIKNHETKPNYLTFLDKFDQFNELDKQQRLTSAYKKYVEELLEYFRDYSRRAKPLFDYEELENRTHEQFVSKWNAKSIPGWFGNDSKTTADSKQENDEPIVEAMIDLESYKSCEQLHELGLDCLKRELQNRGLKCGGTLEERAKRLWAVRGKPASEIDPTLRAAPLTNKRGKTRSFIDPFHIASIESKLIAYADYYADYRQATIENVQRKQARTADERNESDEDISDLDDDENEQGDTVYNPKDLPLGWDGKPIPYWLYKLHGLNMTFTCEICGNATYKGPKTFQRHFAEWRHAQGMRSLGIPNTSHFAYITKIQDAISLWAKLKDERQKDKFQPQAEEEYEDSQGNVVNKKTYEDLKRQGLL